MIVGIPLLKGMYCDETFKLTSQIIVLHSLILFTFHLFLLEFQDAKGNAATPSSELVVRSINLLWMTNKVFICTTSIK
jgi:hypothetical protein